MPIGKPASEVGDNSVGPLSPNLALSPTREWEKEGYLGAARGCVGMGGLGVVFLGPNGDRAVMVARGVGGSGCGVHNGTPSATVTPAAL